MGGLYGEKPRPPLYGREIEPVLYFEYGMVLKGQCVHGRLVSQWQCSEVNGHLGSVAFAHYIFPHNALHHHMPKAIGLKPPKLRTTYVHTDIKHIYLHI